MLRLTQVGNSLPFSFPVDPNAEFEPGMVAQLTLMGNQQVCGVSDGTAPIGIIDDIKKNAFSAVSIDEVVIAPIPSAIITGSGVNLYTVVDVKAELRNPHITESSFTSRNVDVALNAVNGIITFIAGTQLNYDQDGDGVPDAIRTVVSYTYQVANVPGDDSTGASGRITVWFQKMIVATDMFETNQRYPINAPLFVSEGGLFTTRQISPDYPSIAMVTAPPSSIHGSLELLWY
jgi:hypothetical protein